MSTMEEPPLSEFEVIRFLENRGGRCTNYDLVSNFRGILNDPRHQAEARLKFKDIINRVATVLEYQNVKYIELKREYCYNNNSKRDEESQSYGHSSLPFDPSATSSYASPLTQNFQPYWRYRLSTNPKMSQLRKSELESVLRSTKPKFLNRSISESTLPDNKLQQPPTIPFRSKREQPRTEDFRHSLSGEERIFPGHLSVESLPYEYGRHSHTQTTESEHLSTESLCYESGRQALYGSGMPSSGYVSAESSPCESARHSRTQPGTTEISSEHLSTESLYYESGRHALYGSGMPSSGYVSAESSPCESARHSLTSLRDEKASVSSWSEDFRPFKEISQKRPPLTCHSTDPTVRPSNLPVVKSSNEIPYATRSRNDCPNEPIYQSSDFAQRLISETHEENNVVSPNSKTLTDRSQLNDIRSHSPSNTTHQVEECGQDFNRPIDLESKNNGNRHLTKETYISDDILMDPNYFRSVSKLCFSNHKAFLNPMHHSEKPDNRLRNNTDALNRSPRQPADDIRTPKHDDTPPLPPERRRKSVDSSSPIVAKAVDEMKEEKISGKVKDKVQHFDAMEKKQKRLPLPSSGKENRITNEKTSGEDDISISVLDAKLKKEWFVRSSQCDYHSLVALLKKEPKLAALKDVTSTALHWAAKHGDANVVKLIAGAYKVNPNMRSGYTPLHLSSLYKHDMIGHLLIHTYGADPSIRDYYGKKADQYPDNYVRKVAGSKNIEKRPVKQRQAKQTSSFMRIGSLNLRKARKSTVFASVRGRNHSELRYGDSVRKRTNKKENLLSDRNCIEEDSAFGFPLKKQDS